MNTSSHWKRAALALGMILMSAPVVLAVDTVTTVPVGYIKIDIAAGTVAKPVSTAFAIPLTGDPLNSGVTTGHVTGVTASQIAVKDAGWTPQALAVKQYPYAVRFTTGANAGLTLVIKSNNATVLTVATSDDLTTLGIKKGATTGDMVQIIPVDTLDSLFGADTLIGSDDPATADTVYLGAHSARGYYYNTTLMHWVSVSGATLDRGSIQIPFQAMVRVARVGAATSLIFPGRVPVTSYVSDIANSKDTYTNVGFPTDTTLGDLALQTKIPGWVSGDTPESADMVSLLTGGAWVGYYYNGTHWVRTVKGVTAIRDSVVIPAGAGIHITKRGATSGFSRMTLDIPYALQ